MFGLRHRRLEHLDQLGGELAAGTGLIEVVTDRAANVALHRALTDAAQRAVAATLV
jgi:2-succinyl-5-enolpyruvyl-6-hydroxy-3-cyclohexene-1-carboxylate synthase